MQKYQNNVTGRNGDVVTGGSVLITAAGSVTPSTIYSDNGSTVVANPLTTDANGYFEFFVADGTYDIRVNGTLAYTDVLIVDALTGLNGRPTNSELAASDGATKVGTSVGTVQAALDARPTSVDLAAAGGAASVGDRFGRTLSATADATHGIIDIKKYLTSAQAADVLLATPVLDHTAAMQAFLADVAAGGYAEAHINGNFRTTQGLVFDLRNIKNLHASATITCTADVYIAAKIVGVKKNIIGSLYFYGTGTTATYSTWGCSYGVLVSGCLGSNLGCIGVERFKYFGIFADTSNILAQSDGWTLNNGFAQIDRLTIRDCGAYDAGGSTSITAGITALPSTWDTPVNAGTAGLTNQTTTVNVATLPPNDPGVRNGLFVNIEGTPYRVTAVDTVNSKITVYPWIDSALTSGTLYYISGGGVMLNGGDTSALKINSIDAIRACVGVADFALYGAEVNQCIEQYVFLPYVLGNSVVGAAPQNASVRALYTEFRWLDLLKCSSASKFSVQQAMGQFATSGCRTMPPRAADNTTDFADTTGFSQLPIANSGLSTLFRSGRANNVLETSTPISIGLDDISHNVFGLNAKTFSLRAPDLNINRLYGHDDLLITCIGTGSTGRPTGSFTFNPPAGWTVNGTTTAVYSGFTGPVTFAMSWRMATSDIRVFPVGGIALRGTATFNPPSIAAAAQTTTTVTVTGAALGDFVDVGFSLDLAGVTIRGYVSAADTVTVVFFNGTAGAVDLSSGTLTALVRKN